ncbi:GIY-YIG nuclease family protein [uncultured Secundilactobacillus sp.]|uniref:GIY-YIG nuclease family protein n=1 Tax=uncultured Secundilactobacillus sp. TaxID=2813935 RepID=UPI0025858110|nr:GIY-YIG nuclease family protein [uncultured Secundilactobacillus sp.]
MAIIMPNKTIDGYYFYVLYCADNTLYGGFTTNVLRRFKVHQSGHGAKYTQQKRRHPLKLLYWEGFETKSAALKAEYAFKHQPRRAKLAYLEAHGVKLG